MKANLGKIFSILRSIIPSIYFNFHYLPFKQAIRLPFLFIKPRFGALKGVVRIEGPVHTGMVMMGNQRTGLYPDSGVMFENGGGVCVFKGMCRIGSASAISIGEHALLEIGNEVISNAALKLVCFNHVTIEDRVRLGWEVLMMDTGFHRLKNLDGEFSGKGVAPVVLAHDTWVSTRSMIMPGAGTSPFTVVAANSLLNKKFDETHVMLGGSPAKVIKRGVYRDMDDDAVDYAACSVAGGLMPDI